MSLEHERDRRIDAMVLLHIVGGAPEHTWVELDQGHRDDYCHNCGVEKWEDEAEKPCQLHYSSKADLVIPLLERCGWHMEACFYDSDDKDWTVRLFGSPGVTEKTFARAACVALLAERGVAV